jgi:uncharacterized Zn-binding protein involved in type VI secretion
MGRPVAIFKGSDSGGVCPCVTPPTPLAPPVGNVFSGKIAVMANGDVLNPASGKTCTPDPSPCASPRIVKAVSKVFVNGVSIATQGDFLNESTAITIATGSPTVFA